jgi:hypothetical protein
MPGMPDSLWMRLAELPVLIESCGLEPVTTPVRLIGGGAAGLEEDVSPLEGEANTLHTLGPLAGALTLGSPCGHLVGVVQWRVLPGSPLDAAPAPTDISAAQRPRPSR